FPKKQIKAVIQLCRGIIARNPGIAPHHVLAHSDIAPARKMDPGELFPWKELASEGVGIYPPDEVDIEFLPYNEVTVTERLSVYGYNPAEMPTVLFTAFQRHFRPSKVTGEWDDDCQARLTWLLEQKHQLQAAIS
ncbi:MAG TPA: N-acetylmuramoyl-L-alanine amidase, partial [Alphaproteobacteria bacterium]|nr:N-acetylmuramoyl-L-alanine amidase [Alphaproteobacteria bacterium]